MTLIDEVKTILRVKTADHDAYLGVMVPALEDYVKDECNNRFIQITPTETVYPGAVKIFIAKACEYNMNKAGLDSRKMGTVSYSYNLEFPKSITNLLKPYRRLKFHG